MLSIFTLNSFSLQIILYFEIQNITLSNSLFILCLDLIISIRQKNKIDLKLFD